MDLPQIAQSRNLAIADLGEIDTGGWPTGHRIGFEKESSL